MNVFSPVGRFAPISALIARREHYLSDRLSNLKMMDVANDTSYRATLSFIKEAIMLQPIVLGDPVFSTSFKNLGSVQQKIGCRLLNVPIRDVSFPLSGNRELFYYAPTDHFPLSGSNIYLPAGNYLSVRLPTACLSQDEALFVARNHLQPTLQLIDENNTIVKEWYAKCELRIEDALSNFYKEFKDLYVANDLLSQFVKS